MFTPKSANLTIPQPKKCTLGQFSTSESEKHGEFFSKFFLSAREKIDFLGRIFTYASYNKVNKALRLKVLQ